MNPIRNLLIYPGVWSPGWASLRCGGSNEASFISHGLCCVSAALKQAGHEVALLDMRSLCGWQDLRLKIRADSYDIAWVGFLSLDAFTAACVVRIFKEEHPDRPVVVGGVHVSLVKDEVFPPDDLIDRYFVGHALHPVLQDFLGSVGEAAWDPARFPKADSVIWNEAEHAAVGAADLWADTREMLHLDVGDLEEDLDALPLPDFDLFWHEAEYTSPIVPLMELPAFTATFGRGCPYRCTYCSVRHQGSSESPRHKSPARIVEELYRLKAIKGHIGSLMIHDDVHFDHRVTEAWLNAVLAEFGPFPMWLQMRADTICKHPELARLMADAGVAWVSVGAECGSGRMLRYYDKGYDDPEVNVRACDLLHEHGINVWLNYMLGNPTETPDEMEQTVAMVERIRPAFHSSSVYCSYPGTELDKRCEEEGLKLNSFYSTTHYPWQRTIEGIDYQRMYELQQRALGARGELRRPKSLGG